LAIAAVTAAVFWPTLGFDFVSWDDPWYVTSNPHVARGLTWPGVAWAFTSAGDFYWHPLTWMSHMLDVSLVGMNAGGHHLTSLLLHLAATLMLFAVLRGITGSMWRSALVAALFGVHPLRVESVAWVAERKDVLSACFFMLTLAAHAWYVRRPGVWRYAAVVVAFALGLMAKPMIVTLPVVLLLLDVWPLGRREPIGRLVVEKLPLVAIGLAVGALTWIMQRNVGAVGTLEALPLWWRAANAVVSYWVYLGQMLVPVGLAAFYPYPPDPPAPWLVFTAAAALCAAVIGASMTLKRHPYVFVGVLWSLVMLVPVIGLFQAGDQLRADRFTYLPLAGVFILLAWSMPAVTGSRAQARWLGAMAALVVIAYGAAARAQVAHWQNSTTLWTRALAVTTGNHRAHTGLGDALTQQGQLVEAERHYREAVRLAPAGADYRHALGANLLRQGRTDEAGAAFSAAVKLNPRHADARVGLGAVLARQGRATEAIAHYREALLIAPSNAMAHNNLGLALLGVDRPEDAAAAFGEAVRLDPRFGQAYIGLAAALNRLGRVAEARAALEQALRVDPANEPARRGLEALAGARR
jgi:Flp pilus assembly protein TadD